MALLAKVAVSELLVLLKSLLFVLERRSLFFQMLYFKHIVSVWEQVIKKQKSDIFGSLGNVFLTAFVKNNT
jgi:hypothetical protein